MSLILSLEQMMGMDGCLKLTDVEIRSLRCCPKRRLHPIQLYSRNGIDVCQYEDELVANEGSL